MKVEFVLFVEAVNKSASGTLNILGEFNTLYSDEFPFIRPGFAFIVRLKGEAKGQNSYKIRAELVKPGSDMPLAQFETSATPQPGKESDPMRGDIVVNAYGIVFPEPGEYEFNVYIDGKLSDSRSLFVQRPPTSKG